MNPIILVARGVNRTGNEGIRNSIHALFAGRRDLVFSVISSTGEMNPSNRPRDNGAEGAVWVPNRNPDHLSSVGNFLAFWLQAPFLLLKRIRRKGGGIVHFHCWFNLAAIPCFAVARIAGCRIVWTMYSPNALVRPYTLTRWLLNLIDVIVATNQVCLERIPGNHRARSIIVPPAVDIERFSAAARIEKAQARKQFGLTPDTFVIVYVGHVLPGRGLDRLLMAHHILRTSMPRLKVRTIIASSGIEDHKVLGGLERLSREFGLSEEVVLWGYIENVESLFRAASAVILPLEKYGRAITPPLVCIEASLTGSSVLTTGFAGNVEEVSRLLGGRIRLIRDLDSLAKDLKELAEGSEQWSNSSFNLEEVAQRWRTASLEPYDSVYGISDIGTGVNDHK